MNHAHRHVLGRTALPALWAGLCTGALATVAPEASNSRAVARPDAVSGTATAATNIASPTAEAANARRDSVNAAAASDSARLPFVQTPPAEPAAPADEGKSPTKTSHRVQGVPTLGGTQFWTDLLVFHGWRIQRHAMTGHCRLLDDQDRRLASGSFAECRARLDVQRAAQAMPRLEKRVVIITHGLFGTRLLLHQFESYLAQRGDFEVLTWGYASTRGSIDDHAEALAAVVQCLEGVEEISFVAHSMGGLVVRRYLASGERGGLPDGRIRRLVMLGTPNEGAVRARLWATRGMLGAVFHLVAGRAGEQLSKEWEATAARLAVPRCEFGILVGGRGDASGWHEGIPGDDDGIVGVAETRLEGASDYLVLPVTHRSLLCDPLATECTLRFLESGSFSQPPRGDGG